jgi:nitroreductase
MNQKQLLNLCEVAHNAPSADNSQPWHFIVSKNKITIIYDKSRVLNKTFAANNIATLLSLGSVIEAISKTCIECNIAHTLDSTLRISHDSTSYACFSFDQSMSENFTITKDSSANIRHTNRFAYKAQPLEKSLIDNLIANTNSNATNINWFDDKTKIKDISSLIKKASEIRFQTPEVHEWLMQSLRFGKQKRNEDGLHISTLDLPPLGGIFMKFIAPWKRTQILNKFGLYKVMAAIEARPISKASGLIALSCGNTPEAQLQAGRDLFTLWLKLNKAGIAVHPYFVITDQITRLHSNTIPSALVAQAVTLEGKTCKTFNLKEDENLCMLFRVGYPKKNVVRSKRLNFMNIVSIED